MFTNAAAAVPAQSENTALGALILTERDNVHDALFRGANSVLRNPENSHDIAAERTLYLLRTKAGRPVQKPQVFGWLFNVGRHKALDWRKKLENRTEGLPPESPSQSSSVLEEIPHGILDDELSPLEREILAEAPELLIKAIGFVAVPHTPGLPQYMAKLRAYIPRLKPILKFLTERIEFGDPESSPSLVVMILEEPLLLTIHFMIETLPESCRTELLRVLSGKKGRPPANAQEQIVEALWQLYYGLQEINHELHENRNLARDTLGLLLRRYRIRVLSIKRKDDEMD